MAKLTARTPSQVMKISDDYVAFCIDEAALFVLDRMGAGEEPAWVDVKRKEQTQNNAALIEKLKGR